MPDIADQADIVRRFIAIPTDKKRIFLRQLAERGVDFRSLPIPSAGVTDRTLPLSFAQSRLWFLWRLEPESAAYNVYETVRLRGALDEIALARSFGAIVARHDSLRTTFATTDDGAAVQRIREPDPLAIARIDLSTIGAAERETRALQLAKEEVRRPFDLIAGPLLRVTLLRLDADDHLLFLTIHHIVSDAWSIDCLIAEFSRLYGGKEALPSLPIQYGDYAIWQRAWLEGGEGDRQLAYWRDKLGTEHPVLELPLDRPRPPVQSHRGAVYKFEVGPALTARLRVLAQERRATLFMVMLAAFKALLFRYTGQHDIRIGVPVANRGQRQTEHLIGLFVNTLVLRTVLDGKESFDELVALVRDTMLEGHAYQDLPFERLVEVLNPERSQSHTPLFQVLMNHHRDEGAQGLWQLPGLSAEKIEIAEHTIQFDLILDVVEHENELTAYFVYATDLFDAATIARLGEHWLSLLNDAVTRPTVPLDDLRLLTEDQESQLKAWGEGVNRPVPSACLHRLIEEQVSRTPDAVAVIFEGQRLSYEELNRRADAVAAHLAAAGVARGALVGLCVERSLDMMAGLLGILKAGAAYLPLDPAFPAHRLALILEDAQPLVILTQQAVRNVLPSSPARLLFLDAIETSSLPVPMAAVEPEDLAYVLYTSGSTGKPKGVAVPHRAVTNLLASMQQEPGFSAADRLLAVTTLSFDIATLELFLPLISGGTAVIADRATAMDPALLIALLKSSGANVMQATPATWRALVDSGWRGVEGLKILCGGEALPRDLADKLLTCCASLWNMYGPTETTIWSTVHQVTPAEGPVPIGKPIANTTTYVLDARGHAVPVGVTGELFIGGTGVTHGYLNRAELTRERFVSLPVAAGQVLYRTGDYARWRADGALECLGRTDDQVKIRGFRIELGEIEAQLLSHEAVREAVVVARETPQGKQLVGYVTGSDDGSLEDDLRAHLQAALPNYMVPSRILLLERLPLTPNGKVDRKALPEPGWSERQEGQAGYVPPRTALERQLVAIWQEVLGIPQVGITDDFFALGGHSLLVLKLAAAIEAELGRRIPVASIFDATSVAKLAVVMDDERQEENWKHLVVLQRGGRRHKPLFCLHGFDGTLKDYLNLVHFLSVSLPVYGLSAGLQEDQEISNDILSALTDAYVQEIRSLQPEGPYRICGFSFGGSPAFELATRLANAGKNVTLILLDAYAYSASVKAVSWFHGFINMVRTGEIVSTVKLKLWRLFFFHMHYWLTGKDRDLIHGLIRHEQKRKYASFVGRAILFKSTGRDSSTDITIEFDGRNGWSKYVKGPFDVIEVEAGHVGLIKEPAVKVVAAYLNELLVKD